MRKTPGGWRRRVLLTVGIGSDLLCLLLTPLRGGGAEAEVARAAADVARGVGHEAAAALAALAALRYQLGDPVGAAAEEGRRRARSRSPAVLYHHVSVSALEGVIVTPPRDVVALGAGGATGDVASSSASGRGGGGGGGDDGWRWDAAALAEDFFSTAACIRAALHQLKRCAATAEDSSAAAAATPGGAGQAPGPSLSSILSSQRAAREEAAAGGGGGGRSVRVGFARSPLLEQKKKKKIGRAPTAFSTCLFFVKFFIFFCASS